MDRAKDDDQVAKELEDALRKSLFGVDEEQLMELALMLKGLYDSFKEAGFTEYQCLHLLGEVIRSGGKGAE